MVPTPLSIGVEAKVEGVGGSIGGNKLRNEVKIQIFSLKMSINPEFCACGKQL